MLRNAILTSALCLILFLTGCSSTEQVVRTKTVAVIPPPYLIEQEEIARPSDATPAAERTQALLQAYGERGAAITRHNERMEALSTWASAVLEVYDDTEYKSLEDLESVEE